MSNGFRAPGIVGGGQIIQPRQVDFSPLARGIQSGLDRAQREREFKVKQQQTDRMLNLDAYQTYISNEVGAEDTGLTFDQWKEKHGTGGSSTTHAINQTASDYNLFDAAGRTLLGLTGKVAQGIGDGFNALFGAMSNNDQPQPNQNNNQPTNQPTNQPASQTVNQPTTQTSDQVSNVQSPTPTVADDKSGWGGDQEAWANRADAREAMWSKFKASGNKSLADWISSQTDGKATTENEYISMMMENSKARGGYLPGKETGDKNPALLEDGEYVLNREAVDAIGKENLDKINYKDYPRFQMGGFMAGISGFNAPQNQFNPAAAPKVPAPQGESKELEGIGKTLGTKIKDLFGGGQTGGSTADIAMRGGSFMDLANSIGYQEGGEVDDPQAGWSMAGRMARQRRNEMQAQKIMDEYEVQAIEDEHGIGEYQKDLESQYNQRHGAGLSFIDAITPDFASRNLNKFVEWYGGKDYSGGESFADFYKFHEITNPSEQKYAKMKEDRSQKTMEELKRRGISLTPEQALRMRGQLGLGADYGMEQTLSNEELKDRFSRNTSDLMKRMNQIYAQ